MGVFWSPRRKYKKLGTGQNSGRGGCPSPHTTPWHLLMYFPILYLLNTYGSLKSIFSYFSWILPVSSHILPLNFDPFCIFSCYVCLTPPPFDLLYCTVSWLDSHYPNALHECHLNWALLSKYLLFSHLVTVCTLCASYFVYDLGMHTLLPVALLV